ncbi:EF-hand domain-containing protein [Flavobacterium tegetincola]|uniref:EF-hand domain-containing protein n=1 Tax=Flavobacterium tegetincola TaxID=150172 RepID=UPI000424EE46|nr:EF-hand domain-containing protein [Flavobacterium tegetincola]
MKKINLILLLAAIAISCKSTDEPITESDERPGQNGKGQPNVEEVLSKLDTNKDGKISKDEAQGPLKNDFTKIDTNKDGFISKEELANAPKPERQGPPGGGQGGQPRR